LTTSAEAPGTPTWRFVWNHPAHAIAFGFGAGMSPAPGTVGTLVAFPLYALLLLWLPRPAVYVALVLVFLVGLWAADRTGKSLGIEDYHGIVCDEIAAYLATLYLVPQGPAWFIASFIVFRAFDIWKPFPISYLERTIRGALGVMLDDLMAGIYTILVLRLCELVLHG
jgi:phosphatidylglycerophosphatase A